MAARHSSLCKDPPHPRIWCNSCPRVWYADSGSPRDRTAAPLRSWRMRSSIARAAAILCSMRFSEAAPRSLPLSAPADGAASGRPFHFSQTQLSSGVHPPGATPKAEPLAQPRTAHEDRPLRHSPAHHRQDREPKRYRYYVSIEVDHDDFGRRIELCCQ
jgi:hypothetical protein